jgi:hypothetical protein
LEARSQFIVTERLFRICWKKQGRRRKPHKFCRTEDLEDKRSFSPDDKLYASARESEKQAAALQGKKDFENSAKSLLQASVIYEKFLLSLQPLKK